MRELSVVSSKPAPIRVKSGAASPTETALVVNATRRAERPCGDENDAHERRSGGERGLYIRRSSLQSTLLPGHRRARRGSFGTMDARPFRGWMRGTRVP